MATHAVRIEVVVGVGNIAERWLRSCRKMTMTRSGRGSRNACISFRDFSKSMYLYFHFKMHLEKIIRL